MAKKLGLNVSFGLNTKDFSSKMQNVKRQMRVAQKGFSNVARSLAPVGLALGAIGVASIKAASDMEQLSTRLRTAFQGDAQAAEGALKIIKKFSATTPYQMIEVTNAFIKLKNMGLDPSMSALRSYGNTASSMGKSLDQMVEAVADAATGEFERLKEFGIRASKQGDKVAFTFRGVTKEVKFNSEEIQRYLLNIGNTDFAGGMEEQSETLAGQMSTLKDNLLDLAADLGDIFLPVIKKVVSKMRDLVSTFKESNFYKSRIQGQDELNSISKIQKELYRLERLSSFQILLAGGKRKVDFKIDELYWKLEELQKQAEETHETYEEWLERTTKEAEELKNKTNELTAAEKERYAAMTKAKKENAQVLGTMQPRGVSAFSQGMVSPILMASGAGGALGFSQPMVEEVEYISEAWDDLGATVHKTIEQMNQMLNDFVAGSLTFFASKLGEAFAEGGFKNGELGQGILEMTGQFMQQLGALMITTGISLEAFKKGLETMNPALLIGGGIALVAAGAAVSSFARNGYGNGMTGGASSTGVAANGQKIEVTGVIRGSDLHLLYGDQTRRRR